MVRVQEMELPEADNATFEEDTNGKTFNVSKIAKYVRTLWNRTKLSEEVIRVATPATPICNATLTNFTR